VSVSLPAPGFSAARSRPLPYSSATEIRASVSEPPVDLDSLLEGSADVDAALRTPAAPSINADKLDAFLQQQDPVQSLRHWLAVLDSPDGTYSAIKIKLYLARYIALLDQRINEQLNPILHHSAFQGLEASWRGLKKLVDTANQYGNIKIRCLDVSWREVAKDIDRAADFDQSALFNLIYNQEFGIAGGQPYGVLLGDYQVSHRPSKQHPTDDINTLRGMAQIGAAAFAPFICGASAELFGLDNFDKLAQPLNIDNIFSQQEYIGWRGLRAMEDARFLGIVLPQVLMREPYVNKLLSPGALLFNEQVSYQDSSRHLWGNACYALGIVLIREFGDVGWFSHIRGAPRDHLGGGLVTDFPCLDYGTDSPSSAQKIITQVVITDSRERQLSGHGLLSLCDCYDTPFAAFLSCPSLQQAKTYTSKAATANARMSAMLQQILCASRFAHYIKVMIRDKVGSFTSANECQQMLQEWLNQYTTGRDDLAWDALSRYPLRSARIEVREKPGMPGIYTSIIHLKPHYIVDQLVSELRLTSELHLPSFGTN